MAYFEKFTEGALTILSVDAGGEIAMGALRFLGLVAAVVMPFWNIPLVIRIVQRRSCADISLLWLFGIWGCITLMLPSSLLSTDIVLKAFGISNFFLFSLVVVVVMRYRKYSTAPASARLPSEGKRL